MSKFLNILLNVWSFQDSQCEIGKHWEVCSKQISECYQGTFSPVRVFSTCSSLLALDQLLIQLQKSSLKLESLYTTTYAVYIARMHWISVSWTPGYSTYQSNVYNLIYLKTGILETWNPCWLCGQYMTQTL